MQQRYQFLKRDEDGTNNETDRENDHGGNDGCTRRSEVGGRGSVEISEREEGEIERPRGVREGVSKRNSSRVKLSS